MMRRMCLVALLWVGIGLGLAGAQTAPAIPVEVVSVERGPLAVTLRWTGSIAAQARVQLAAKIRGHIANIYVEEGQTVVAGQTLAELDATRTLQLQVQQAEQTLRVAELGLATAQALAQVRAEANLAQAKANLQAAQAAYDQISLLSKARILADIDRAKAGLDGLVATLEKIQSGAREEEREQVVAALEQAKANYDRARSHYDRMQALFRNEVISQEAFDAAEAQFRVAEAQYEIARQQLRMIDAGARDEDIEAMRAQVRQAQATLDFVRLQATEETWEYEIAQARSRLETAQAALKVAQAAWDNRTWEAEIATAQAKVQQARIALELAREQAAKAQIVAPFDGIVAKRYVDIGAYAMPGATPLFDLIAVSSVDAVLTVSEVDLPFVQTDRPVQVMATGLNEPIVGTLWYISPALNEQSHTATVKVRLDNSAGLLRPGMYVEATYTAAESENALRVPRRALFNISEDRAEVMAVENNVVRRKVVELGITTNEWIEVRAGLSEGDLVVVSSPQQLQDGQAVQLVQPGEQNRQGE